MKRRDWVLLVLCAAELAVGGALIALGYRARRPPVPNLTQVDELTVSQIRDLAEQCRVTDDWLYLGDVYLASGFYPEAEACYREAAEREPDRADLAYRWAFGLERLGLAREANDQYRRAIERGHPRASDAWYLIGRNALRQEQSQAAREAFGHSRLPAADYELARLDVSSGEPSNARQRLASVLAGQPHATPPALLNYRIDVLSNADSAAWRQHAARSHQRLLSPFDVEAGQFTRLRGQLGLSPHWKSAEKLLAAGKWPEAESVLASALEVEWRPPGADLFADVESQRGRPQEAVRRLLDVIARDSPSLHYLERLGDAYLAADQLEQAGQAWERALRFGSLSERKNVHSKLYLLHEKQGDRKQAQRHQARAFLAAGSEAFWKDRLDEAQAALEKSVELDPSDAHAWFYLAETHRWREQLQASRAAYQRCLTLDPDHGRALRGLSRLH